MKKSMILLVLITILALTSVVATNYYCEWSWPQKITDKDTKNALFTCPSSQPYCKAGTTQCCKYNTQTKVYSECIESGLPQPSAVSTPTQTQASTTSSSGSSTVNSPSTAMAEKTPKTISTSSSTSAIDSSSKSSTPTKKATSLPTATESSVQKDKSTDITTKAPQTVTTLKKISSNISASSINKTASNATLAKKTTSNNTINQTPGNYSNSSLPNTSYKQKVNDSDVDLCENVTCQDIEKVCEDNTTAKCTSMCNAATGKCETCEPKCTKYQKMNTSFLDDDETNNTPETTDLSYAAISEFKVDQSAIIEVVDNNDSIVVTVNRRARLFGLIPVNMEVELNMNKTDMTKTSEKKPWWDFLSTENDKKNDENKKDNEKESNVSTSQTFYCCWNHEWLSTECWAHAESFCTDTCKQKCYEFGMDGKMLGSRTGDNDNKYKCNCSGTASAPPSANPHPESNISSNLTAKAGIYYCNGDRKWVSEPCWAHREEDCNSQASTEKQNCSEKCAVENKFGRMLGEKEGTSDDRWRCECYGTRNTTYYCCYVGEDAAKLWRNTTCWAYNENVCDSITQPEQVRFNCSEKCAKEGKYGTMVGVSEGGGEDRFRCKCTVEKPIQVIKELPGVYFCCGNGVWKSQACWAHREWYCDSANSTDKMNCSEKCNKTKEGSFGVMSGSEGDGEDRARCTCKNQTAAPQIYVPKYQCCADSQTNPSWSAQGRKWIASDKSCPNGTQKTFPTHCDVYPSANSCSKLCNGGHLAGNSQGYGYCSCPKQDEINAFQSDPNETFYCCGADTSHLTVEYACYNDSRFPWKNWDGAKVTGPSCWNKRCEELCIIYDYANGTVSQTDPNICKCSGTFKPEPMQVPVVPSNPIYYCCNDTQWSKLKCSYVQPEGYCKGHGSSCSAVCADNEGMLGTMKGTRLGTGNDLYRCECSGKAAEASDTVLGSKNYQCCVNDNGDPSWSKQGRQWISSTLSCPAGLVRGKPDHCDVYPSKGSCDTMCAGGSVFFPYEIRGYCSCNRASAWRYEITNTNFMYDLDGGKNGVYGYNGPTKAWIYSKADAPRHGGKDSQASDLRVYDYVDVLVTGPEGKTTIANITLDVFYAGIIDDMSGVGPVGGSVGDYAAKIKVGVNPKQDSINGSMYVTVWQKSSSALIGFLETASMALVLGVFGVAAEQAAPFAMGVGLDVGVVIASGATDTLSCTEAVSEKRTITFENIPVKNNEEYRVFISLEGHTKEVALGLAGGYTEIDFYNARPNNCDGGGKKLPVRGIKVNSVKFTFKD